MNWCVQNSGNRKANLSFYSRHSLYVWNAHDWKQIGSSPLKLGETVKRSNAHIRKAQRLENREKCMSLFCSLARPIGSELRTSLVLVSRTYSSTVLQSPPFHHLAPGEDRSICQNGHEGTLRSLNLLHTFELILNCRTVTTIVQASPGHH